MEMAASGEVFLTFFGSFLTRCFRHERGGGELKREIFVLLCEHACNLRLCIRLYIG